MFEQGCNYGRRRRQRYKCNTRLVEINHGV